MKITPVLQEKRQYNNQPSFGLGYSPETGKFIQSMLEECGKNRDLLNDVYNSRHCIKRFFKRPRWEEKAADVFSAYENKQKEMLSWGGEWKLHLGEPDIADDLESRAPEYPEFGLRYYRNTRYTTKLSINNHSDSITVKNLSSNRFKYLGMYNVEFYPNDLNRDAAAYSKWCSDAKYYQELELFKSILKFNKKAYLKAIEQKTGLDKLIQ